MFGDHSNNKLYLYPSNGMLSLAIAGFCPGENHGRWISSCVGEDRKTVYLEMHVDGSPVGWAKNGTNRA